MRALASVRLANLRAAGPRPFRAGERVLDDDADDVAALESVRRRDPHVGETDVETDRADDRRSAREANLDHGASRTTRR